MARSTYKPRRMRKRTSLRRRRQRRNRSAMNKPFIPDRVVKKLIYNDRISIDPATGLASVYQFRANSIYDPDYTGIGHQPMGHDEMVNFYNSYTVLGARLKATFFNPDNTEPMIGTVALRAAPTVVQTDPNTVMEGRQVGWRFINDTGSNRPKTITKYYSGKKMSGVSDILDQTNQRAGIGHNPGNTHMFQIHAMPIDSLTDLSPVTVNVRIEYIVMFQDPKNISGS